MRFTVILYAVLVAAIGAGRLFEITISRRHRAALAAKGVSSAPDPHFRWLVAVHVGVLVGSVLEVWLLDRPFIPILALGAGVVIVLSSALRWWVIRTMADHWNVRVMNSVVLGVVIAGPYRYIRHPNYLAVFLELLAIPLLHTAILTAILGTAAHVLALRLRIRSEEAVLMANPAYRDAMGHKPRFLPRLSDLLRQPAA